MMVQLKYSKTCKCKTAGYQNSDYFLLAICVITFVLKMAAVFGFANWVSYV